jgi:nucleotide-binding universal stress UspA family protein
MVQTKPGTSVVVGVDGSSSAVHAAVWAVEEAVSRDIPLRLIHVIQSTAVDVRREADEGEAALDAAHSAVTQTGRIVKVDSALVRGPVAATLVAESSDAAMLCVGSAGVGRRLIKYLGSIAAAVAQSAPCQVAVIRTSDGECRPAPGDIAVVIEHSRDLDTILEIALQERQLRHGDLLILNVASSRLLELLPEDVDRRLNAWLGKHSDVTAHVVVAPDDIAELLAARATPVRLTVVAAGGAATHVVGPYGRYVLQDTDCSVLVVPPS